MHSFGVLPNADIDHHDAFSSVVQLPWRKIMRTCADWLLVHECAAHTINIDYDNLRKVCAEFLNVSTASIVMLYH